MKDILGMALLDYYNNAYTEDIIFTTNISEEDEMPLPYLFRDYTEMPNIEQRALQNAKGTVLDIVCGVGNRALYLQNKGLDVLAIDVSKGAIDIAKKRGVIHATQTELLALTERRFDTILLLSNGTGVFGSLKNIAKHLQHLKTLLSSGGQILIDSTDLRYMYDQQEGQDAIWIPADRYYGELSCTLSYKGELSDSFAWLYLDSHLFENAAKASGFTFEIIEQGDHFDYLAKLTIA